jgi:predicted nucleic acid-binding protein
MRGLDVAVVVDASVVIKWFIDEDDSAIALALRTEHDVMAPDLLLIECRNILLSKVRHKQLTTEDALQIESDIGASGIEIVPSDPLLPQAFALALELREPIYDSIYLAAAIAADRKLITADVRFVAAANRSAATRGRVELLGATSA